VARIAAPSPGVPAAEIGPGQAIVISLGQKSLSLVHGEDATFTTYVALGRASLDTPSGTYQVLDAYRLDDMSSDRNPDAAESYSLPNVPWTLYFQEGGYAIHGTYWHDAFGTDQSQGCVNLTVSDAAYVYGQLSSGGARGTPVLIVD
jgi:lipoprotein-anchoring transpeptidase ErfK/SrfK